MRESDLLAFMLRAVAALVVGSLLAPLYASEPIIALCLAILVTVGYGVFATFRRGTTVAKEGE